MTSRIPKSYCLCGSHSESEPGSESEWHRPPTAEEAVRVYTARVHSISSHLLSLDRNLNLPILYRSVDAQACPLEGFTARPYAVCGRVSEGFNGIK